jgi:hypothetical protein
VQNQPVVRVAAEGPGHNLLQLQLDLQRVLARCEPGAISDAEDVRVDRERLFSESRVQNDVGGLAPNAGKLLQLFAGARDLAAMIADQGL